ncbi:glyoxysomal fatty acid beta-oxidation multifunctional protein MFP-a-like isoform X1 [Rhododendron vialii]|uniref:glyoxysomal fatty acid beta-oxidation multifunctional protein MFP-a-like isoform X1 n=2 Tax=Rhododendron vialii TaxID=182163 RepID=UPI00265DFB0E|nr:glyoxysomal fatty acid beta-oxidation multifunctional protein MFP-a-like isoform X1 [Rhododendron vialii]
MKGRTVLEVGADGVAIITITNPPLNLLSVDVMLSLKESIEEALPRENVKAIVVTGSGGKFSGGFDVSVFGGSDGRKENQKVGFMSIEFLTDVLEAASKPIVAAIGGPALGGGFEVALACHARISTSTAQLGLPELQFGLIPGLGGTQRLPRLVGLTKALEMMLMSTPVTGQDAHILGLVDSVAPTDELVNTARSWALQILARRRPWVTSLHRTDKLESLAEARAILKVTRCQAQEQAPNLRHQLICINVIEEGIISGPRIGLLKEAEALEDLRQSEITRSLVHIFFARRGTSKIAGITDLGLTPRKVNRIAVVGGGLMGSGIATALIVSDYHVVLKEVNESSLLDGIGRVKVNLESQVKRGKMTQEKIERTLSRLNGVLSYDSFKDVDLVIEAVAENLCLKQQILFDIEKYCPQHSIFACNTSAFDLNAIGERTKSQNRIIGAHFFCPAYVTPLLEIVRTERTSPQVIVDLLDVGKRIKKTPVVVGNCTGFAIGRMFFPYSQSAMLLVERGADVYRVDHAITKFGMPLGPFRVVDRVGFEVAIATSNHYVKAYPERAFKPMLISVLQEENRAGESTRKGFYLYDDNGKASPDPDIQKYVERAQSTSDVTLMKLSDGDIVEMIFFPIVNEACRILAEGVAVKASDLDIASVLGMEFPAYRGGIIFWANSIGSTYICSKLKDWSMTHGDFFKPCAYLVERAAKGASLGASVEQANSRL